jgi:hypothetical protein
MAIKARFLRRTDVPPLPRGAPINAIARRLAREIERAGHFKHQDAVVCINLIFGTGFTYTETVKARGDRHLPDWQFYSRGYRQRQLLHPEILWAPKKLTGKNIIWGKDCRERWLAKGAKLPGPRGPTRGDDTITPTTPS